MRWWLSVTVGTVLSLPLAWLLSYAATLPFLIGLFFFVLLGLLIGAIVYRVAAPGGPYSPTALVIGTTTIVATVWCITLVKECRDLPDDMAKIAAQSTRDIGDRGVDEFYTEVRRDVRQFLRERYPPGGIIGYMRWVLTNGAFMRGELPSIDLTLRAPQNKGWWAVRVVLSLALLGFGVGSQTLGLSSNRDVERAGSADEPEPERGADHAREARPVDTGHVG